MTDLAFFSIIKLKCKTIFRNLFFFGFRKKLTFLLQFCIYSFKSKKCIDLPRCTQWGGVGRGGRLGFKTILKSCWKYFCFCVPRFATYISFVLLNVIPRPSMLNLCGSLEVALSKWILKCLFAWKASSEQIFGLILHLSIRDSIF